VRLIPVDTAAISLLPFLTIAAPSSKNDLQRALADFEKFSELAPSDPNGPKAVERITKALSGR
jgi:hypothetical protein